MICVRSDQSSSRMLFLEPKNLNCCLVSLLEPGRAGQGRGQNRRHVGTIFIWDHERFHVMSQICKIIYGKESKPKVWSKIWQKWLNINWSVSVSAVKNLPLSEDDEGFTKENDLLNNNCLVQLSSAQFRAAQVCRVGKITCNLLSQHQDFLSSRQIDWCFSCLHTEY